MKFISQVEDVKLLMWEKTEMPESSMEKDANNKTVFKKTGKMTEMTTYTFRNGFGEKLVILSKYNNYRELEGKVVDLVLDVQFNDFSRKNKISLESIAERKVK